MFFLILALLHDYFSSVDVFILELVTAERNSSPTDIESFEPSHIDTYVIESEEVDGVNFGLRC